MHADIGTKIKRTISWQIQGNHKNTIRTQTANTSKSMIPCRRGALLAKTADFTQIAEDIQLKHDSGTSNNPKTIQNILNIYDLSEYSSTSSDIPLTLRFRIHISITHFKCVELVASPTQFSEALRGNPKSDFGSRNQTTKWENKGAAAPPTFVFAWKAWFHLLSPFGFVINQHICFANLNVETSRNSQLSQRTPPIIEPPALETP